MNSCLIWIQVVVDLFDQYIPGINFRQFFYSTEFPCQVQELRGNIRVFCRCRYDDRGNVALQFEEGETVICRTAQGRKKVFEFERVYPPHTTQEKVRQIIIINHRTQSIYHCFIRMYLLVYILVIPWSQTSCHIGLGSIAMLYNYYILLYSSSVTNSITITRKIGNSRNAITTYSDYVSVWEMELKKC